MEDRYDCLEEGRGEGGGRGFMDISSNDQGVDEMNRLSVLEPTASDYNVARNYLDWLTILPWGIFSTDSFNLRRAKKVRVGSGVMCV